MLSKKRTSVGPSAVNPIMICLLIGQPLLHFQYRWSFLPGAKNAHKSPFELAGGQTYDLPWIQAMNVHNAFAFLFTENAI